MADDEELKAQLRRLGGEIEHLTATVEKKITPEQVEEVGRLVSDMRLFLSGLMLPWRKEIRETQAERELWKKRIDRGEAELVNEVVGKYAIYRSYHHLPSSETYVETTPV